MPFVNSLDLLSYFIHDFPYLLSHRANCSISEDDIQAVGRVYIYKYPSLKPISVLSGMSQFENFGYDMDLSRQMASQDLIAISSIKKGSECNAL